MIVALVYALIGMLFVLFAASFHKDPAKFPSTWSWIVAAAIWPVGMTYVVIAVIYIFRERYREHKARRGL